MRAWMAGKPSVSTRVEGIARNLGVPVHECAGGTFLPCPDVQRVERGQPEAVGGLEQVKELSHQLRCRVRMRGVPDVLEYQKIRANEPQAPAWHGLVDHDLGTRRVQYGIARERQVHEVHPHRPGVWSADAAE